MNILNIYEYSPRVLQAELSEPFCGSSEDQTSTGNMGSKIVHEVKIVIWTLSGIEVETICITSGKKRKIWLHFAYVLNSV